MCVVSFLLLHAISSFVCARFLSVTHDEYWHLPVGLLNLTTGRFDYDNLNPPLVRMWAALPLLATAEVPPQPPGGAKRDAIAQGDAFLAANRSRYDSLFLQGRVMIIVLSVATGLIIAAWARALFGERAALLSLLLWSACPTALMNASLVTTDMGAAFFFILCSVDSVAARAARHLEGCHLVRALPRAGTVGEVHRTGVVPAGYHLVAVDAIRYPHRRNAVTSRQTDRDRAASRLCARHQPGCHQRGLFVSRQLYAARPLRTA